MDLPSNFDWIISPHPDPTGILIGRADAFASQCEARPSSIATIPPLPSPLPEGVPSDVQCIFDDPRTLVSDHCGSFVRLELNGPAACELRNLFVDTPRAEGLPNHAAALRPYRLVALPAGGGSNLEYRWEPSGATTAHLDATAGEPHTQQSWTVTVRNPVTGVTASRSVVITAADTPCFQACRSARQHCRNCRGEDCPLPSECCRNTVSARGTASFNKESPRIERRPGGMRKFSTLPAETARAGHFSRPLVLATQRSVAP